jgi:hypothetical protein
MKSNPPHHITEKQFIHDCTRFTVAKLADDKTYREFLKYFKGITKITFHHMVIGINFTYGWMPTAFDFRSDKYPEAVKILNQAKVGADLTVMQLAVLKNLFNNSLVGTTKLLHFINPMKFAIWDSRVYRYFNEQEPHQNRIGDCNRYLIYLQFCDSVANNSDFEKIHKSICKKLGYQVTKFRSIELIMYHLGGK